MKESQVIEPAQADIKSHNRISKVWLIPFVAFAMSAWMVLDTYYNSGPDIVITFDNAKGLKAGKTRIKTRNVDVGYVDQVLLNDDKSGVIVHVKLDKQVEDLLHDNADFWVVSPKIGRGGISGLSTITSGAYIEFVAGDSHIMSTQFVGLEHEPITAKGVAGVRVNLVSDKGDSLSIGEPVMYRGFEVGRVESSRFNIAKRQVHYQIFVKSPYSELLTENTYFWNSSGVDFSATAEGVKINVGSLESIISGGITFDVPTDLPLGGSIDIDENHILYPDKNSVYEQRQYHSHEFIVLFKDSVRGLNAGAPVAYRGIRLGTVVQVVSTLALVNEFDAGERRIPVKIKIEPARFGMPDTEQSAQAIEKYVDRWVEQGLKASLKSGSLLTGKLFVDLNYYDVAKRITASGKFHGVQIIPSVEGSLAQIEQKVFAILDKFEKMPINVTIDSINKMLSSADASINQLNGAVAQVKELLSSQQTQDIPDNINKTLSELSKTLASYNQQGPMYSELQRSMVQFQQLMREIEPLIKGLNNKPNALIFKSQAASDPEPKGTSK